MVWSHLLRRQWVILATTDVRLAVEMWPPLNATVASFRVLDEGLSGEELEAALLFPTILVIGAIAILVAIAVVALLPTLSAWRKRKREGLWRPPRNWRV